VPWSRVRKGDRQVVINSQKVTITERDEAHGWSRSATSAAPRSGAPATSPTAPATR
jgi:hypothetical protein